MVSIYRRGRRLYLQYPIAPGSGKRIQRSTGLEDTPANRKMLKSRVIPALEAQIASGELLRQAEEKRRPRDFGHYADRYLEAKEHLKTYWEINRQVKRIREYFDGDVTEITRGDVRDYAAHLLHTLTPKTARKYLNVLMGILEAARDYEAISVNPATGIALPTHHEDERDPFSAAEVDLILSETDGWFRNYMAVAFYTGARPGEILALRVEDIDLKKRTIRIEKSVKNGKMTTPKTRYSIRTVPIFDALMPYLRGQLMHSSTWLFENADGNHYTGSRTPRHHWNKMMERLRLPYRDMYSTRHTFITHMLMGGQLSILEIAQIVGHKNATQIMQSYARFIADQHLRISRNLDPFACNPADTKERASI